MWKRFPKKMRAMRHIGHTGWLCGITCLAHLIDVVYDFPVTWNKTQHANMSVQKQKLNDSRQAKIGHKYV